ncbi:MAG: hypothetical protein ACYCWW_10000 [Deltaproteobacteria bacterium]
MRFALALAALLAQAACLEPAVESGVNPVEGCVQDTDCPQGFHCAGGACQLAPRPCKIDAQCDPGQTCQNQLCEIAAPAATDGGSPQAATFQYVLTNVIQNQGCTVCHRAGAGATFGSLDLVTDPYTALLGASGTGQPSTWNPQLLRVVPGNASQSFLYLKITQTGTTSQYGQPMPPSGSPPLPSQLVEAVQSWINAGAQND